MPNTLIIKRSSTTTVTPNPVNMEVGELAVNTADKRLWTKHGAALAELTDHDTLTNYVANEHIDWTSATQNISTSGTIEGGNVTSGIDPGHTHTAYDNYASWTVRADSGTDQAISSAEILDLAGGNGISTSNAAGTLTISQSYATATTIGGIELFSNTDNPTAANTVTSTASRTYGLQLNAANQGVVNVPWTDTVYLHPSHPGDDFSVDTGALTGATVVSDIDINVTTDTLGHVTDANGVVSTRTITLDDIDTNSVKKNATETITGTWTLDGVVTTADYGTGGRVKDGTDVSRPIGFNVMPVYEIDVDDTFDLAHNGMIWHRDAGTAVNFTCNNDGNIPVGATYVVFNEGTDSIEITQGTANVFQLTAGGAPTSGSVTVEQGGIVTVYKYSDTEFWVWGDAAAGASGATSLDGLTDVTLTSPTDGAVMIYDTGTSQWRDFTLSGDVTMTDSGVTTVANNSHSHQFSNVTAGTSSGDFLTDGDFGAGENSGGPALTINDGYGNSNLTFNHRNGTPDNTSVSQSACRIEATTDSTTASLSFELGNSTVQDTPVALTQVMEMTTGRIQSEVNHDFLAGIDVTGNITVTGTVDDVDLADVLQTTTNFGGDVSGTYNAIVVTDDSHTHAFNNLTGKTSGTGNYTTTGDMTADNFEATGLGPNTTPGTDDAYIGGYGMLGSRAFGFYISNAAGAVRLNHSGVHGVNTKLDTTATGVSVTGTMAATTVTGANVTSGSNPGHTHTIYITSNAADTFTGNLTSSGADIFMADNTIDQAVLQDYAIESVSYTPNGTAQTLTYSNGPAFEVDLESVTGTTTITLSGGPPSGTYGQITVKVTQDSTTARAVNWLGGTFEWAGGTEKEVTTTLNGFTIFTFETWNAGSTWFGGGADYA